MMGAAERIKEYLDFKGISKYKFCKELGFSPKFLDNTSNIGTDKAGKILRYFPELNPDWLISGQGSMLRKTEEFTHNAEKVIDNWEDANALKDERIRSLEREVELLREMVEILKQSRGNSDQLGGEIKRVG